MDENFIADDVPVAPSMADFYPDSGQLNVSDARNDDDVKNDDDVVKEKSLADELSEQLTLAETDTIVNQNENVVRSDIGLAPSEEMIRCQNVHYPVLPDCDDGYLEAFEADAPPAAYDEEACEAATAPPMMFFEASAPLFEDQLAEATVASEQLMLQEQEEAYAAIQPFTELQVIH